MPFVFNSASQDSDESPHEVTEQLERLLTEVACHADDGGTDGITLTGLTFKIQAGGGWLLVARWNVSGDSAVRVDGQGRPTNNFVSFTGAARLCDALRQLEESLAGGTVELRPDKFAPSATPARTRPKRK